ncbi:MAG: PilZ domain-containing protein, partial [Nitrospirota bacterium]
MPENKRTYKRFDLPLIVKFRPTFGTASYSLGLTKNLSCEGIGLEARNFNFVVHDNLELELKLPQNAASVFLLGDVVWKRQDGKTSYAGIAFKTPDPKKHNETMEKITSYTRIPLLSAHYMKLPDKITSEVSAEQPVVQPSTETKSSDADSDMLAEKTPSENARVLGLQKNYLDDGKECEVSFLLPQEAAKDASNIAIVGDFNDWNSTAAPMIRNQNGDFQITLKLASGREYRFKYLI